MHSAFKTYAKDGLTWSTTFVSSSNVDNSCISFGGFYVIKHSGIMWSAVCLFTSVLYVDKERTGNIIYVGIDTVGPRYQKFFAISTTDIYIYIYICCQFKPATLLLETGMLSAEIRLKLERCRLKSG